MLDLREIASGQIQLNKRFRWSVREASVIFRTVISFRIKFLKKSIYNAQFTLILQYYSLKRINEKIFRLLSSTIAHYIFFRCVYFNEKASQKERVWKESIGSYQRELHLIRFYFCILVVHNYAVRHTYRGEFTRSYLCSRVAPTSSSYFKIHLQQEQNVQNEIICY